MDSNIQTPDMTEAEAAFAVGEDRRRRAESHYTRRVGLRLRPATAEAMVNLPIEAGGLAAAVEEAMGRLMTEDRDGRTWAEYLLPDRHGDEDVLEVVVRVRHSGRD